jgi:hypothetical protein
LESSARILRPDARSRLALHICTGSGDTRLRTVADDIPENVKRLIAERIESIPELEAVLLLKDHPERDWDADEAGGRLYVSRTVAAHLLAALAGRGFLRRTGESYRYFPSTDSLRADVDDLAQCYARQLVAVTQLVHAKPGVSVRSFADAFRFRKD